jgi:hypothetical protein
MPTFRSDRGDCLIVKSRCGLEYFDENGVGFFIDGEMVVSDDYDFAVYADTINCLNNNQAVDDDAKASIMVKVQQLCSENNFKIRIFQ